MQLNEILEAYSIRDISKKTNISEDNVQNILEMKFNNLTKVRTMGFISILEREYSADLTDLRNIAHDYYNQNKDVIHYARGGSIEEKKSSNKSAIFILAIVLIFGYASFYFFTQFDNKHLSTLNPFSDDDLTIESNITKIVDESSTNHNDNSTKPKVDIIKIIEDEPKIDITTLLDTPLVDINSSDINNSLRVEYITSTESNISTKIVEKSETNTTITKIEPKIPEVKKEVAPIVEKKKIVTIEPSRRLWFGIRDIKTKKRDQFSIAKPYKLDVSEKSWLVATSPASFYLIVEGKKTYYKGGKAQYFKITKDSIEKLTKREYVRKGGWRQW